jgi:hypothetical protein
MESCCSQWGLPVLESLEGRLLLDGGPYPLVVENGSGDGTYSFGQSVSIAANSAPPGEVFNMWIGDVGKRDGFTSLGWSAQLQSSTTYSMPDHEAWIGATYRPANAPTDWWPRFDLFSRQTFGAEAEPLAYELFGEHLEFENDGHYVHISEKSAFVGFETNLPANVYIEYGTTTAYGLSVQPHDSYHYLHNAYISGLNNNTTYHYRFVATDERGNTIVSPDYTLRTATPANVIRIPGGHLTTPMNLNVANATYLLEGDIVADYRAFNLTANGVKLDLGGHTVTYNNVDYQLTGDWPVFESDSPTGVRGRYRSNVGIYNGFLVQGAGYNNAADSTAIGYSPLSMWSSSGEIAGVSVEYWGASITGIDLNYGSQNVHHNTILDRGGEVINRHSGPKAINGGSVVHHNLVLRARQGGIGGRSGGTVYDNEIYVDSVCTNSFAIGYYEQSNVTIHGNRIFGSGYLLVGIGAVSGCANFDVYNNFMHLQAQEPDNRWPEYGAQSGTYGVRIVWDENQFLDFHDNVFAVYGRDGGQVRGIWMYTNSVSHDIVFRDNIIKAINTTPDSTKFGAVDLAGDYNTSAAYTLFENNRIISNFSNVSISLEYGHAVNTRFVGNTFVRSGPERSDYVTIRNGYYKTSINHYFYDSKFEGGASYDEYRFIGSGTRDFYVGWTLGVAGEHGASVTITDRYGSTAFTGSIGPEGVAEAELVEYRQTPGGRTYYSPYTVRVTTDGVTQTYTTAATPQLRTVLVGEAGGEVSPSALPDPANLAIVEDHAFWADVYVRSHDVLNSWVFGGTFGLSFDPDTLQVLAVEPAGDHWQNGDNGVIDNLAGTVTGISRHTLAPLGGDDEWILLARVQLTGQAAIDAAAQQLGPFDAGLSLLPGSFDVPFGSAVPTAQSDGAFTYPVIYDFDNSGRVAGGDLSYFSAAFGQSVGPVQPPYTAWADFDGNATVGESDKAWLAGAYRKAVSELSFGDMPAAHRPPGWTSGHWTRVALSTPLAAEVGEFQELSPTPDAVATSTTLIGPAVDHQPLEPASPAGLASGRRFAYAGYVESRVWAGSIAIDRSNLWPMVGPEQLTWASSSRAIRAAIFGGGRLGLRRVTTLLVDDLADVLAPTPADEVLTVL